MRRAGEGTVPLILGMLWLRRQMTCSVHHTSCWLDFASVRPYGTAKSPGMVQALNANQA